MTQAPATSTRWWVGVLGAASLGVALWGAAQWSLIPQSLNGTVSEVGYQSESGYRWRTLQLTTGKTYVIDRRITDQFEDWQAMDGERITKPAGGRTVQVGTETANLALSVEFWKVFLTMGAVAVVAWRRTTDRAGFVRPPSRDLANDPPPAIGSPMGS